MSTCNVCADPFSNDNKQLFIVTEVSAATKGVLSEMVKNLAVIMQKMNAAHTNWITSYVVHGFEPNGEHISTKKVYTVADAQGVLLEFFDQSQFFPADCERPRLLFNELRAAFNYSQPDAGEVIVISAGTPDDKSFDDVIASTDAWGKRPPKVHFLSVEDNCTKSQHGKNLNHFIATTNGMYLEVNKKNIFQLLLNVLPTRYSPQLRYSKWMDQCNPMQFFDMTMDTAMRDFYVVLSGRNESLGITGPTQNLTVNYENEFLRMYHMTSSQPATYSVSMRTDSSPCRIDAYGVGGVDLCIGISHDRAEDFVWSASDDEANYPVIKVISGGDGILVTEVKMLFSVSNGGNLTAWTGARKMANGMFESEAGFNCENGAKVFITVSGADSMGARFERRFVTWCIRQGKRSSTFNPIASSTAISSSNSTSTPSSNIETTTKSSEQWSLLCVIAVFSISLL